MKLLRSVVLHFLQFGDWQSLRSHIKGDPLLQALLTLGHHCGVLAGGEIRGYGQTIRHSLLAPIAFWKRPRS
jgi:hypothetical protein